MAVPQNKAELLAALRKEYGLLLSEIAVIAPERRGEVSLPGHAKGTTMSVHDLLAYLLGWSELVLAWHAKRQAGEPVDFPETGFRWNQLGQLAQKFYKDYEALAFPALQQALTASNARVLGLIERHDDAELYGRPWYEQWTMGRMIQLNTSSPYANARARLRKWRRAHEPAIGG